MKAADVKVGAVVEAKVCGAWVRCVVVSMAIRQVTRGYLAHKPRDEWRFRLRRADDSRAPPLPKERTARQLRRLECGGHEPDPTEEPQGVTVYCDGGCRRYG